MDKKNKITNLLIWIIAIVVIVGGVYFFKIHQQKPDSKIVVAGYLPIYADLPLFIAQDKGFFDKRGVQVELKRFVSSTNLGAAILTGNVEASTFITTTVAFCIESRDPGKMKIFMVDAGDKTNYSSGFVALKESGIESISELKGKKIGGFPGPIATIFGKMVLTQLGLDPEKDVKWIELPASNQLSALESKEVDALFSFEPTSTQAVMGKNAIRLLPGAVESYIIEPWQAGVWVLKDEFIKNYPIVAKNFILAIYDAVDYIRLYPDSSKRTLINYTVIKLDAAMQAPDIPYTKLAEVDLITLQNYANLHLENGLISKKIDVKTMILPSQFLESK